MGRRDRFRALAAPVLCPVPLPFPTGAQVVIVTADPRESPAGTCLWSGFHQGYVQIGGDAAECDITITIRIKGSRKWE